MHSAARTFQKRPPLPLEEDTAATPGALRGRRRLAGAFLIELSRIRTDPAQPRRTVEPEAIQQLAESVRSVGILQPITVRYLAAEDRYQIISGQRRFEAARLAGLTEMPCWVQSPQAGQVLLNQIVENWQRVDLEPFEIADALAALRDANGYPQKRLAQLTGKPESEISRLLSLLSLHPDVQNEARQDRSGKITRRHLFAVATAPLEKQPQLFQSIQRAGLTAVAAELLVRDKRQADQGVRRPGAPEHLKMHFATSHATVTIAFRRKDVSKAEVFATLDEVRKQVQAGPSA